MTLHVDIWSDVVCPWCYIGKRRFERAVERFAGRVTVTWHSFELDPTAPRDPGIGLDELLAGTYGMGAQEARAANARVTGLAAAEGLDYRLDRARPGNTFDAHRLVHLAEADGLGEIAVERLFHAYFVEGRLLGELDALVELAGEIGLAPGAARAALESDACADEVRADEELARQLGIRGVPFFAIDGRIGVSGAQSVEHLVAALEQAAATSAT
jgi:predicted DsbA family dithiol-disulfide isomerase